jgi:hypothetical protein
MRFHRYKQERNGNRSIAILVTIQLKQNIIDQPEFRIRAPKMNCKCLSAYEHNQQLYPMERRNGIKNRKIWFGSGSRFHRNTFYSVNAGIYREIPERPPAYHKRFDNAIKTDTLPLHRSSMTNETLSVT